MAARYILPALAVAGRAIAQSSSCSNSATTTIQNAGDASALARCSTYTGSIAIATGTTDSIALNGIQDITGSLVANNVTSMSQLSGDSLTTIGDSFSLNGLTILTSLNFPRLAQVGTVDWVALPQLQGLSFTTGLQQAGSVTIVNTQLNTLSGINLQTVDSMQITNNPYLNAINMQLGNVTQALVIQANGRNVSVTFPNLIWAYNITLANASSVSIPSLSAVNGSLGFYSDYFSSISAPNLTSVGGSLSIVANPNLNSVDMPELKTVGGGFTVANNTQLMTINDFGALQTVGGALNLNGALTNVSLPAISDVRGAFNLTSTGDVSAACSTFRGLSGMNNVIKGTYTCNSGASRSGSGSSSASGSATASSGSSSSSATHSSPANVIYISGATGVMGVVAAIFGML
ncbi:hypothetical protein BAUCODRAFT_33033 [Baudoinia panamericana UAMH 10762]|uniref:GPI-anchored cell wall organization protein Ecm33 n=1 Tax=Baudoinia panamericana (strain UAMH 10762) TaxID=717646 RepID=M2NDL0_BAUPA|nr:uncharacterized protein BAUCODRAFT_33033 [Baudoinia panamericana UAMH 10762]EMC97309.1 hypothetical protein BAUCODRAFT_33033 [Baudoinia panamericana UAMH 10762]